jgi:putative hemolysin
LFIALVIIKGAASGVEASLAFGRSSRAEGRAKAALENPERLENSIKILKTLCMLTLGCLCAYFFSRFAAAVPDLTDSAFADAPLRYAAWAAFLAVLALPIIFAGSQLPTSVAKVKPEAALAALLPIVGPFCAVLSPLSWVMGKAAGLLVGGAPSAPSAATTEEIESDVIRVFEKAATGDGETEEEITEEKELIQSVFRFDDTAVGDIAIHRQDVVALPVNATPEQVKFALIDEGFTRVPVYDGEIDEIRGILNAKDFFKRFFDWSSHENFDLEPLLSEEIIIPHTKKINDAFETLNDERKHLAIVVDESGGVFGIITLEDIIEQIFGDIRDETDETATDAEVEPDVYRVDGDSLDEIIAIVRGGNGGFDSSFLQTPDYIIDGLARPDDVSDALGIEMPPDFANMSSFLISTLGEIPEEDFDKTNPPQVEFEGFKFVVAEMEGKRVGFAAVQRAVTSSQ